MLLKNLKDVIDVNSLIIIELDNKEIYLFTKCNNKFFFKFNEKGSKEFELFEIFGECEVISIKSAIFNNSNYRNAFCLNIRIEKTKEYFENSFKMFTIIDKNSHLIEDDDYFAEYVFYIDEDFELSIGDNIGFLTIEGNVTGTITNIEEDMIEVDNIKYSQKEILSLL